MKTSRKEVKQDRGVERALIHQPSSQGEQKHQVGMHGEKEDRRVVRREGGQQPAAAPPDPHLFIPAGQRTHLEAKERSPRRV